MCVRNPNCPPFAISRADTQPKLEPGIVEIVSDDFSTRQPTCQPALNGECGNTGDASVHADGAKSMLPKRVACALR